VHDGRRADLALHRRLRLQQPLQARAPLHLLLVGARERVQQVRVPATKPNKSYK